MIYETLSRLKELSLKGPIKADTNASNQVGKILRRELGIDHSISKKNQLNGFIISSTVQKAAVRRSLFAKVPNWKTSYIKSKNELLDKYGHYYPEGIVEKRMHCTVKAREPNSFGLKLKLDRKKRKLYEAHVVGSIEKDLLEWDLEKLEEKLLEQDKKILVSAIKHKREGGNYFHYRYAEFFIKPNFKEFLDLIEFDQISLDHQMTLRRNSKTAEEKGPNFKISKYGISQLYSEYSRYDLMD